jgi:hypothetical protein
LPIKEGKSQATGNPWKVQSYVIEDHGDFPRKMCFDVFGEDKIKQFNIQPNEEMTVSFDIDAHKWQDRWFNSIRAWKVDRSAQGPSSQTVPPFEGAPAPAPASAPAPADPFAAGNTNSNDDLPF